MSAPCPGSGDRNRRSLSVAAPGFVLLLALLYADPLWTGRTFTGRDQIAYNLPMAYSIHDAYSRGRWPVWTPEISGGRPLLPNPNVGALYPVRPLLSRLSFPLAMRIYPIAHWAAAGIGTMLLLASIGVSPAAAWIGASTYVFSGISVSDVFFPHLQPGMTLLPWVLWLCRDLARARRSRLVWLAAILALDFFAADVFTGTLAIACAILWIALETGREGRVRAFLRLAAAVGLAALAAAPQIVATALWIPETHRAVVGMNLSEATGFSLSPWRLLELIVPYPFGETWRLETAAVWGRAAYAGKAFGFFLTMYSGALAAMAIPLLREGRHLSLRFARLLLAVAGAAAILPSLMPAAWGKLHSPLPLRNPEKLSVAIVLALSILCATAFDRFRVGRGPVRAWLGVAVILAAVSAAAALAPAGAGRFAAALAGSPARAATAAGQLPFALAEAGLLWTATVAALEGIRSRRRIVFAASCAALTLVPIVANRRIAETSRDEEAFAPTPFARRIQKLDPEGRFRTLGEAMYRPAPAGEAGLSFHSDLGLNELPRRTWIDDTQIFWRRGSVLNEDFDVGDLARVESLRKVSVRAAGFRDSGPFFANLGLRWGIRYRGQDSIAGFRRFGGDPIQDWDEQTEALPDIRLTASWVEERSALDALHRIGAVRPGELLLETGRAAAGRAAPGRLWILEKSPERLRIETQTPDPTWLFVLRGFWSHRTVTVDGRPVDPVPAYLAYTAVPVPRGRHTIVWRERIPGGKASRWGPVAAIGIAAAVILVRRRET